MSRAFVKEQDGSEIPEDMPERPVSEHPNLVTPRGLRLIEQQIRSIQSQRDAAKRTEDTQALASIERELRYWLKRKSTAQVVQPDPQPAKVRFGVRVRLRYEDDGEQSFAIVGEDEADPSIGTISYISPIARSLLGCEVGDAPVLRGRPVEILSIEPIG